MIEGHAGCFFQLPCKEPNGKDYSILSFASRLEGEMKVQLVEIDHDPALPAFTKRVADLSVVGMTENDFPISLSFDSNAKVLLVYTKFGHCFVIEPNTATCVHSGRFSDSPLFLVVPSNDRSCHFVFNRKGEVLKCSSSAAKLAKACMQKGTQFYASAAHLADQLPVEAQKELYRNQFDELKNSENYRDALILLVKSGKPFLRSFEYMTMIKEFPQVNNTAAILEYFFIILQDGSLNEAESIELAQLALKKNKLDLLRKWSADSKIHFSSQIGDLILEADPKLALEIFETVGDKQKAALAACLQDDLFSSLEPILQDSASIDFVPIIQHLAKDRKERVLKIISFLIEHDTAIVDQKLLNALLVVDIENFKADLDLVLAKNTGLFDVCSDELIASYIKRLVQSHPEEVFTFINSSVAKKISKNSLILALLEEHKMYSALFCLSHSADKAAELIGNDKSITSLDIKVLSMESKEIVALIKRLLEDESNHTFCLSLSKMIDEKDFKEVKEMLSDKIDDDAVSDYLTFWSSKIQSDSLALELLTSNLKMKKYDRVEELCKAVNFDDPKEAFELLKSHDVKLNALMIVSTRFSLEEDLIALYAEHDLNNCMARLVKEMGADKLLEILPNLIDAGINTEFLSHHLQTPSEKKVLIDVSKKLESAGKLEIISQILKSCPWTQDGDILTLRAKIICVQEDYASFAKFMSENKSVRMPF